MVQPTNDAYEALTCQQRSWAQQRAIALSGSWPDYVTQLEDNLFQPLSPETRKEYAEGGGDELMLQKHGKPPKLFALHSSAALVCNLFDYWRQRDVNVIATACGADPRCTSLRFEQKRPIRQTWRTPPHPDCEFQGIDVRPTAVESKFLEPYNPQKEEYTLHPVYTEQLSLWDRLPRCGQLAIAFSKRRECYALLDVPQLLRHILGLVTHHRGAKNFRLLYLWYEVPGQTGEDHRSEIERLQALLGGEIDFSVLTHQQVFRNLLPALGAHSAYRDYMVDRYFRRSCEQ